MRFCHPTFVPSVLVYQPIFAAVKGSSERITVQGLSLLLGRMDRMKTVRLLVLACYANLCTLFAIIRPLKAIKF